MWHQRLADYLCCEYVQFNAIFSSPTLAVNKFLYEGTCYCVSLKCPVQHLQCKEHP